MCVWGDGDDEDQEYVPPQQDLTPIGWVVYLKAPGWEWLEQRYLKTVYFILTQKWWLLQSGHDMEALMEWVKLVRFLEMDKKAVKELFLLLQSGEVGRAHGNKLMWTFLTGPAIEPPYVSCNRWFSTKVKKVREEFDRPPRGSLDLWTRLNDGEGWWWNLYKEVQALEQPFSPRAVPSGLWALRTGDNDEPLPPPDCYGGIGGPGGGPVHRPAAAAPPGPAAQAVPHPGPAAHAVPQAPQEVWCAQKGCYVPVDVES